MKAHLVNFKVVIPARYDSTRLPGKPLLDIGGKPMIVRVMEQAMQSHANEVWVACDDERIVRVVEQAGGQAMLTQKNHTSGTDRIAEVVQKLGWDEQEIVVNPQGDEPLMKPALIDQVALQLHKYSEASIATAAHRLMSIEDFLNPNVVKVVCDTHQRALYFSRASIPWPRDDFRHNRDSLPEKLPALHHIGIYAYRVSYLRTYQALTPCPLEYWEALEQLRALWYGHQIVVYQDEDIPLAGVDTEDDLQRVRQYFMNGYKSLQ